MATMTSHAQCTMHNTQTRAMLLLLTVFVFSKRHNYSSICCNVLKELSMGFAMTKHLYEQ